MTTDSITPAKRFASYLCAVIGSILLFYSGPGDSLRSVTQAWNLGHIILFAALSVIIWHHGGKFLPRKFLPLLIILLLLTLLAGGTTEVMQIFSQRTPDIADIWRDCLGTLIAAAFLLPASTSLYSSRQRKFQFLVIFLTIITLIPLGKALIDETIARHQFPLLADFETPFELARWEQGEIDHQLARHGHSSLKVLLTTAQYSGDSLLYFPSDWSQYATLHFSVHNGTKTPLAIVCRLHDRYHAKSGNAYHDRFNRRLTCQPGWNAFAIPLKEIRNAPTGREMDMAAIINLRIFTVCLTQPVIIHLDYFYLEK
jgi:VanZ family protein